MSILQGKTIKRGKYSFTIECDIPDWKVWVYYDGKPLMVSDGSDRQVYKWLGDDMELNKGHLYNFINKFVNDENYRNKFINGEKQ